MLNRLKKWWYNRLVVVERVNPDEDIAVLLIQEDTEVNGLCMTRGDSINLTNLLRYCYHNKVRNITLTLSRHEAEDQVLIVPNWARLDALRCMERWMVEIKWDGETLPKAAQHQAYRGSTG